VKFKRLMALVMSIALTSASYPFVLVASQVANQTAGLNISGTVVRSDGKTAAADACLRLRNVDTNTIVARAASDRNGAFALSAPEPGTYLVEIIDCKDGRVLAVSDPLGLPASLTLKPVVVLPSAVKAGFFSSTAFKVLAAASAAGITAYAVKAGGSTPAVSSPEQ
jgi:hypothetical protein